MNKKLFFILVCINWITFVLGQTTYTSSISSKCNNYDTSSTGIMLSSVSNSGSTVSITIAKAASGCIQSGVFSSSGTMDIIDNTTGSSVKSFSFSSKVSTITTTFTVSHTSGTKQYYISRTITSPSSFTYKTGLFNIAATTVANSPTTPSSPSPSDGSTDQSISPSLSWTSTLSGGTITHDLYYSTSSTFATSTLLSGSGTTQVLTGLANGTTYYWKVISYGSNGTTSSWSPVWSFTTVAATPPTTPSSPSPSDGSTGQSLTPTLSWASTLSGGTVSHDLYISTSSTFTTKTLYSNSGTSQAITGLSNGITYYWKVISYGSNGTTSSWSPVWSFTTVAATPPTTPSSPSPSDGSTGQSLTPTLSWTSTLSGGTVSHDLYYSTSPTFTSSTLLSDSGTTQVLTGLANGTTYYWKVISYGSNGTTSSWSPVWSFTTVAATPPTTPSSPSPSDGSTGQSLTPTLSWTSTLSGGAVSHDLYYSTSSTFTSSTLLSGSGTTQVLTGLANGTTYYWKVISYGSNGTTSSWSPVWSFTTVAATPPTTPSSPSPSDGSTGQSLTPTLSWTSTLSGGTVSHDLYYSTSSTFTSSTLLSSSGTTQVLTGLANGTTYYWKVISYGSNGTTSSWSPVWSFTTVAATPPTTPSSPSPSDGSTGQSLTPTLSWTSTLSGGTVSHDLYISTSSTFTTKTLYSNSGTSQAITGLSNGTTYYWKVISYGSNGTTSSWSPVWSFTTVAATSPTTPSSPSPSDGSTDQSISPALSWTSTLSGGTITHDLYYSTSSTFATSILLSGSGTTQVLTGLANGTTYYWKVLSYGSNGTKSSWSPVWSFTTQNSGTCDLSGVSTTSAYYDATLDLCGRGILSGSSADGSVDVGSNLRRSHLAKIAFRGLYTLNGRTIPTTLPSDNYPSVYPDLNVQTTINSYYYQAAKALLYLEYGDGISPFDRNRTNFNPTDSITRVDALKVLLETFNIKPDLTNINNPFPGDPDAVALMTNNPFKFGYIRKAASLGIITTTNTTFKPFSYCLRGEAFIMLDRIIQKIEAGTITDPNPTAASYYEPLNVTLETVAMGLSLQQGNFNHYTKTSFALDGMMPLNFAHAYNSSNTELPAQFYGDFDLGNGKNDTYKPMGSGWSHSYHTFATQIDGYLVIHWGGGKIDVYQSNGTTLSPYSVGLYDNASISNSILTVKTKSQVQYLFKRLNTSGPAILQLYSIVDRNGNTITINYVTGQNNTMVITSVSDGQRQLNFTYKSGTNLVSQITDPLSRSIKFDYTYNSTLNEYQLTQFTDAKGQITQYIYGTSSELNQCKLLQKIQLPKGNYIQNEYDANRRLSKTVTGINGVPTAQTAVSVNANYQTGALSSAVKVTRSDSTSTYNYNFDKYNNTTAITGSNNLIVTAAYTDTKKELPTSVSTNSSNLSSIQYDGSGNVTQVSKKSMTGSDVQTVSMTYTNLNDIKTYIDAKGNTTTYNYDSNGNLTGISAPESSSTSISVNANGLPIKTVNPEGVTTSYDYNTYGNISQISIPALNLVSKLTYDNASRVVTASDFKNLQTQYLYDNNDNLLTETDPMNYATRYAYDTNDNLQTITNAKGGVTTMSYDNATDWLISVAFGGASKQYAYNPDGTLKTFTKPDGTVLTSTYDALGRITSDGVNTYTYDSNLRLSTVTRNGKTLTYSYDGFNRVVSVDYNDFANNKVQYTYDVNGNITSIIYPGGKTVSYTYDGLNRMKTLTDWNSKVITYSYRKDNQLQSVAYPNGMAVNFTYDGAGRQIGKTTIRSNASTLAGYTFKLDSIGNITQETKTEPYQDILLSAASTTYNYNTANRIQSAGSTNFTFDSNGNTTQRGSSTYSWDATDKITSGDGLTFDYDGLGNRRANGSKRYMLDIMGMGNVLAECDASGNPTAYYLHGLGLEARILPTGTTEYYVSDFRGSTVAMVDATTAANITHKYQYDDFGNLTQQQETDVNPFRYVGKYGVMYENDHLVYMRARYYDPTIGRFMSEDPVWSTNLYPYADNNAIKGIDPKGLQLIPITVVKTLYDISKQIMTIADLSQNFTLEKVSNTIVSEVSSEIIGNVICVPLSVAAGGATAGTVAGVPLAPIAAITTYIACNELVDKGVGKFIKVINTPKSTKKKINKIKTPHTKYGVGYNDKLDY